MDELKERFHLATSDIEPRSKIAGIRRRMVRRRRRRRVATLVVVILAGLAIAGGVYAVVRPSPCEGLKCARFSSFPTGDRLRCPTEVAPERSYETADLVNLLKGTAETGHLPWSRVDPVTRAEFGSEGKYLRLLHGRAFDDIAMSIGDPADAGDAPDPIAVQCGPQVAAAVTRVQIMVRRSAGGESLLDLVFVRKQDGPPLLWLTTPSPEATPVGKCALDELRPELDEMKVAPGSFGVGLVTFGGSCRIDLNASIFLDADGDRAIESGEPTLSLHLSGTSTASGFLARVHLANLCAADPDARLIIEVRRPDGSLGIPELARSAASLPSRSIACSDPGSGPTLRP